jgi:hypothetical protein
MLRHSPSPASPAGQSEIGQGKLVATPKKEMKKQQKNARTGGRKKLPAIELKTKKLQMHVTEIEYKKIQVLYHASSTKAVSDFQTSSPGNNFTS